MREVDVRRVTQETARLCMEACYDLPPDVLQAIDKARETERSPLGRSMLERLVENAAVATAERMPYCHDTGMAVVFVEIGQDAHLVGGSLEEAINAGVRQGYEAGYLRKSVADPLLRTNTGDNTPAVIHTEMVPGDRVKITVLPKGGGSENMGALEFLMPGDGIEGVKKFVLDTVIKAGGKACPPVVIGVGIGGNFDYVAYMAKKALLREVGQSNPDARLAQLEQEILESVNKTGIGPQGLGGTNTALWVAVETYPTHITALPVAVNLQCHAARRKSAVL
ncbi:MAG TPA: fumarate hydratase [Verrucomicrobiae bacterium]|nr:fumarate hydratase [Verrucomicrobiae bacterium]